jgi:hypothetical protein
LLSLIFIYRHKIVFLFFFILEDRM